MVSPSYKVVVSSPLDFPVTSFSMIVRVISSESGNPPLQGATVILRYQNSSMSQETDQNGEANFPNLAQGTYSLIVRKEGFLEHEQSVSVPQQLEIVVTLKKLLELVIEVRDQDTSQPIQGARVRVRGNRIEREVNTDQNGIVRVQVAEGQYTVTVSREGYTDSQVQVTVPLPQGQNRIVIMLRRQSASPSPPQPSPSSQPDRTILLGLIAAAALIAAFTLLSSGTSKDEGEE